MKTNKKMIWAICIIFLFLSTTTISQGGLIRNTLLNHDIRGKNNTEEQYEIDENIDILTQNEHPKDTCIPYILPAISKEDNVVDYVEIGSYINYTICYENPNCNTIHNVIIKDDLPSCLTVTSSSHPYEHQDNWVIWYIGDLYYSDSDCIWLNVTVGNDINPGTEITNVVTIYCDETDENTAEEVTIIGSPCYEPLNITKDDNLPGGVVEPYPNGFINYTISFCNPNAVTVDNVYITDSLPGEVEYIDASSDYLVYNDDGWVVWYIDSLNPDEQRSVWLLVQVKTNATPGTDIINTVKINASEIDENTTTEKTIVFEGTPPVTTIEIIGAYVVDDEGEWVSTSTIFWLNATDPGLYASGVKEIRYIVNGIETVVEGNSTNFTFYNECIHNLEYWAIDNAGNNESPHFNTFYVDETPPNLGSIEFGCPKIERFYDSDGIWYTGIGKNTDIWINSTGDEGCNGGVGTESINIDVLIGENYGLWESLYSLTIHDNDIHDENPLNDEISACLKMNESCWHQIHYWAYDGLGNRNPVGELSFLSGDFIVDADPPETTHYFTEPLYNDYWISEGTLQIINANDVGCPIGSGVEMVEWWINKKVGNEWLSVKNGTVIDGDANDNDGTNGSIELAINVDEDGEHYIFHQSVDRFGNIQDSQKVYVRADSMPPETCMFVGDPHHYIPGDDTICIQTTTMILLQATDFPTSGAVGVDYLYYEIWSKNNVCCWELQYSNSESVWDNVSFYLSEPGEYKIRWYSVDLLGNIEEMHTQLFIVDDTTPIINIIVGQPNVTGADEPDYWVTSDTTITIDVENNGYCPELEVRYRLNRGDWVIIDPSNLPFDFTLPSELRYELEVYATDFINPILKTMIFYVDNTPPDILLLEPRGGWYSDGVSIPTVLFALDVENPELFCEEVGIPDGNQGNAFLIDIFPEFNLVELDAKNFTYNEPSHQYIGNVIIPKNTGIPDGTVLFVAGASDALGNDVTTLLHTLRDYYNQSNGDEDIFEQLIYHLTNNYNLVWLGIDNTPPTVIINCPENGSEIGPDIINVSATITDGLSGIASGTACHFYLDDISLGTIAYNGNSEQCEGFLLIPDSMPSGTNLNLTVTVYDVAGNMGFDTINVDLYNEPHGDAPSASIIDPKNGSVCHGKLLVNISAEDDDTDWKNLTVVLWVERLGDPTLPFNAVFNETSHNFTVQLNLSSYTNGTVLKLQALVTDTDQNTGVSMPILITTKSNVIIDRWMAVGWNEVNLGFISEGLSVETIFKSINSTCKLIFELGTGHNYIFGEGGNTLHIIDPTVAYLVKMKTGSRFYLEGGYYE